jgi:hypothetical protein
MAKHGVIAKIQAKRVRGSPAVSSVQAFAPYGVTWLAISLEHATLLLVMLAATRGHPQTGQNTLQHALLLVLLWNILLGASRTIRQKGEISQNKSSTEPKLAMMNV